MATKKAIVGRRSERDALKEVTREHRWVTVHGPMGAGKTTLSKDVSERFDSPLFLDLSAAKKREDILTACANQLDLPLTSDDNDVVIDQVGHAIAATIDCLILDNFEQVMHCVPLVECWFDACPDTTFIVTSREPLRSENEHVFELGPMQIEDARALFLERAERSGADRHALEADESSLDALLFALDYLPLAIELAAARTSLLSAQKLLERLNESFEILKTKQPDLTPRQATLRGAIAWSWDLLDAHQREALVLLSAFQGRFSVEHAERLGVSIDMLETLVEKSLLMGDDGGIRMLFGVRAFVRKEVGESDVSDADYRLAKMLAEDCRALQRKTERVRFVAEQFATMWHAFRKADNDRDRLSLFVTLDAYYAARGTVRGRDRLVAFAHFSSPTPEMSITSAEISAANGRHEYAIESAQYATETGLPIRGKLMEAKVRRLMGDGDRARAICLDLVSAAEETKDPELLVEVLSLLGSTQMAEPNVARTTLEDALAIARREGLRIESARILNAIGAVNTTLGDFEAARSAYQRALVELEGETDLAVEGALRSNLGLIAQYLDDLESAKAAFEEAHAVFQRIGFRRERAIALGNLGDVETSMGDLEAAQIALDDARLDIRDNQARGVVEVSLGALYHVRGDVVLAREWYETARDSIAEINHPHSRSATWFLSLLSVTEDEESARALLQSLTMAPDIWGVLAVGTLSMMDDEAPTAFESAQTQLIHTPPAIAAGLDWVSNYLSGTRVAPTCRWVAVQILAATFLEPQEGDVFVLHEEAMWFEWSGERVDIRRRGPARLLLKELVRIALEGKVEALDLDALFAIGWPDEMIGTESAHKRVYAAIGTLRRLGLEDVIVTTDDGYLIDPNVRTALSK